MESIAKIRKMYHIENKAIRAIAKELGISKNTVKKIIRSDVTKPRLRSLVPTLRHFVGLRQV